MSRTKEFIITLVKLCKWRFHFRRAEQHEQPRLINGEARAKAGEIELEAAKLVKALLAPWRVCAFFWVKDLSVPGWV